MADSGSDTSSQSTSYTSSSEVEEGDPQEIGFSAYPVSGVSLPPLELLKLDAVAGGWYDNLPNTATGFHTPRYSYDADPENAIIRMNTFFPITSKEIKCNQDNNKEYHYRFQSDFDVTDFDFDIFWYHAWTTYGVNKILEHLGLGALVRQEPAIDVVNDRNIIRLEIGNLQLSDTIVEWISKSWKPVRKEDLILTIYMMKSEGGREAKFQIKFQSDLVYQFPYFRGHVIYTLSPDKRLIHQIIDFKFIMDAQLPDAGWQNRVLKKATEAVVSRKLYYGVYYFLHDLLPTTIHLFK